MVLICCEFCINTLRLPHFKAVSHFYDLLEGDLFSPRLGSWLGKTGQVQSRLCLTSCHTEKGIEARFLTSFISHHRH